VAARLDVPVTGTQGSLLQKARTWQVSTAYRWQKSDRHFVGSEYQADRDADSSQVVNRVHLLDLGVRYNLTDRSSLSLSVPYFQASRSNPIRNQARVVIDRSVTHASSISDTVLTGRRWMRNPDSCKSGNISLGAGVKLPTGQSNHTDVRRAFSNGTIVSSVQPVDQSIQPGDGGTGFLVETTAFRRFGTRTLAYASATYLSNPQEMSDTDRGGTDPNTRFLSISDQYLARIGAAWSLRSWTVGLGGRLEGVPSSDLIGGSKGFRRPGFAISAEPSVTFRHGRNAITAGLPIAVYRNRTRSFADKVNGGHGDAAFADYLVMVGFSRAF
jgi:hypothetical protein